MNTSFKLRDLSKERQGKGEYDKQVITAHFTFNNKRTKLSTGIKVEPALWNAKSQKIRSKDEASAMLNAQLEAIDREAANIQANYILNKKILTPELLKAEILKTISPEKTLIAEGKNPNENILTFCRWFV